MKYIITYIVLTFSVSVFAQTNPDYAKVILDGKPTLINTKTGEFVDKPVSNTTYNNTPAKVLYSQNTYGNTTHVVTKGQTLFSIARAYYMTVNQLKQLNNLSSNTITIGQQLQIINNNNVNYHEVKKGETLYSISKQYGITVEKLKQLNSLTSNVIKISQRLIVN